MSWIQNPLKKIRSQKKLSSLAAKIKFKVKVKDSGLKKELQVLLHKKSNKRFPTKFLFLNLNFFNRKKGSPGKLFEKSVNMNFLDPTGQNKKKRQFRQLTSVTVQAVFVLGIVMGLGVVGASVINGSNQQAQASSSYFCPDNWTNLNNGLCVKAADSSISYACLEGGNLTGNKCLIPNNGPTDCSNGNLNPPICDTPNSKPAGAVVIYSCQDGNLSENLCTIQATLAKCPNEAINPPICTVFPSSQNQSSTLISSQAASLSIQPTIIDSTAKIISSDKISFSDNTRTIKTSEKDLVISFSSPNIPSGSTCDIQARSISDYAVKDNFSQLKLTGVNPDYNGSCSVVLPKNNQLSNRWEFLINIKTPTEKFFSLTTYNFLPSPIPAGSLL